MHELQKFYLEKYLPLDKAQRYKTILHIDDVLIVNFDCIYEREGTLRALDQIIYLCHDHGRGKKGFLFLSEDGININMSGALLVINSVIECFNLTEDNCLLICREQIQIPNATVITNESIPFWCNLLYPIIKDIPIPSGAFKKKFAVWYNRGTFWRTDIARHLVENYQEDSFISYQESGMIVDKALVDFFDYNIHWANNNTPIVYDKLFPKRVYTHDMIVGSSRKPYDDYFIEIVAETDILSCDWITEKTVKNLYIGKPFLIFGAPGTLAKIKSFGFKTFSPWIDESYDQISNSHTRLTAIKKEIDRLASHSIEELGLIHTQMISILEHNRQTYGKYINCR